MLANSTFRGPPSEQLLLRYGLELGGDKDERWRDTERHSGTGRCALGGIRWSDRSAPKLRYPAGATHVSGDFLHRFDSAAHDAGTPVLQRGAHGTDLVALEGPAQLLEVGFGVRHQGGQTLGPPPAATW